MNLVVGSIALACLMLIPFVHSSAFLYQQRLDDKETPRLCLISTESHVSFKTVFKLSEGGRTLKHNSLNYSYYDLPQTSVLYTVKLEVHSSSSYSMHVVLTTRPAEKLATIKCRC